MGKNDYLEMYQKVVLAPLRGAVNDAPSTREVAEKAGVTYDHLATILWKQKDMRMSSLLKLCGALNLEVIIQQKAEQ